MLKWFKKKNKPEAVERKKTIFDLPFLEQQPKLASLVDDIYDIVESEKFNSIFDKVKLPKDLEKAKFGDFVNKEFASKIKTVLEILFIDKPKQIVRILATVFCEDEEEYGKKSIKEILADIKLTSKEDQNRILGFMQQPRK